MESKAVGPLGRGVTGKIRWVVIGLCVVLGVLIPMLFARGASVEVEFFSAKASQFLIQSTPQGYVSPQQVIEAVVVASDGGYSGPGSWVLEVSPSSGDCQGLDLSKVSVTWSRLGATESASLKQKFQVMISVEANAIRSLPVKLTLSVTCRSRDSGREKQISGLLDIKTQEL